MIRRTFKRKSPIIVILEPENYEKQPRIQRECHILTQEGYNIHVIDIVDTWSNAKKRARDDVVIHSIFLPKSPYKKIGNPLQQILYVGRRFLWYLLFYIFVSYHLFKLSRQNEIVFIHCNHIHSMPIGIIFKRILNCKLVYDAYEFYYLYFIRLAPSYLVPILHKIEPKLSHHADIIITWWETIADFLRKRYNLKNIVIFPNLPPTEFFVNTYSDKKRRKELGISSNDFVILYAGRLTEEYKLRELLEACEILVYRYKVKNIKTVVIGSGPLSNSLKKMAKNLEIDQNCIFLGRIPYKEISNLYQLSNVVYAMYEPIYDHLMLPSSKIFEAMICKKPVITCHLGEKKRIVQEARCGVTIRPDADEIARVLLKFIRNEELGEKMGVNGYKYLNEFLSWERYSKSLLFAYRKVLRLNR